MESNNTAVGFILWLQVHANSCSCKSNVFIGMTRKMQIGDLDPHAYTQTRGHTCTYTHKQVHTWYVLSKLSYMNRVIRDVFPTAGEEEEKKLLLEINVRGGCCGANRLVGTKPWSRTKILMVLLYAALADTHQKDLLFCISTLYQFDQKLKKIIIFFLIKYHKNIITWEKRCTKHTHTKNKWTGIYFPL